MIDTLDTLIMVTHEQFPGRKHVVLVGEHRKWYEKWLEERCQQKVGDRWE